MYGQGNFKVSVVTSFLQKLQKKLPQKLPFSEFFGKQKKSGNTEGEGEEHDEN